MSPQLNKRCPVCGRLNSEDAVFCDNSGCGADISAVRPTFSSAEAPRGDDPSGGATSPVSPGQWVCPKCQQPNDAMMSRCACGHEFPAEPPKGERTRRLILVVGEQSFECKDGDILGREGSVACQVFASLGTVSRQHVRVNFRDGRWFVTVPSNVQNITQLDGRDLKREEPCLLNGEHRLKMSTKCEVRLRVTAD